MDGIQEGLLGSGQPSRIQARRPSAAIRRVNRGCRDVVLTSSIARVRFHNRFVGRCLDCAITQANGTVIISTIVSACCNGALGVSRRLTGPRTLFLARTYI